jgi:hypothetical protein
MRQLRIQFSEIESVDRLYDPGRIVVQRQSTVHSELLHEGELVEKRSTVEAWQDILAKTKPLRS